MREFRSTSDILGGPVSGGAPEKPRRALKAGGSLDPATSASLASEAARRITGEAMCVDGDAEL